MNNEPNPNDVLASALSWREAGHGVALATVVHTWGSSPRPIGSQFVVRDDAAFAGSVSGGCIETQLISEALDVIADGRPQLLTFGVSDEQAWQAGMTCGGQLRVWLQSLTATRWLIALQAACTARRPAALISRLSDGAQCVWLEGQCAGDITLSPAALADVAERVVTDRSGLLDTEPSLFARIHVPSPRLLIVGAVHIAQLLIPMAATAGFDVTLIDPRPAFANRVRFPDVALCNDWPERALATLRPDETTAVVTLSHDPKLDDQALCAALTSPAFYIGALGSTRTHVQRQQRLREQGLDDAALVRIHAPVGLDLGGRLPAEIAVAIMAQVIRVRYRGTGGSR